MRERKNHALITAAVVLMLFGIIAVFIFRLNRRGYELHLPAQEKLAGISVEGENGQADITDGEAMKDLIYVLSGSGSRNTKEESISDAPVNAEGLLRVDFHFAEEGNSTLFVFKRGGQYYIEQPYNGIYKISGDEYNAVEDYIS